MIRSARREDFRRWFGVVCAVVALLAIPALALGDTGAGGAALDQAAGVPSGAPGGWVEALLFYLVAGGTLVSGLGVCVSRNIVRMAVWLFMALALVALLYFLLSATFLGAIQLIIYAGGTLVLLVFGVMLTSKSPWVRFECGKLELIGSAIVCGLLLACLCTVLGGAVWRGVETVVPGASVADIGRRLLTYYLVPFEVAGVLLFVVMVGAAHLARQQGD